MVARNVLLLGLGFAAGNAATGNLMTLAFKNASLYEAAQRIHADSKVNMVFRVGSSQRKSFTLVRGTARDDTVSVAKQFGRDVVSVSGILILDPTLGGGKSGAQRLAAADDWLNGVGGVDGLRAFKRGMTQNAKDLAGSLGPGQYRYADLSEVQQAGALDLLRKLQIAGQVSDLAKLFSTLHSPPLLTLPTKTPRPKP